MSGRKVFVKIRGMWWRIWGRNCGIFDDFWKQVQENKRWLHSGFWNKTRHAPSWCCDGLLMRFSKLKSAPSLVSSVFQFIHSSIYFHKRAYTVSFPFVTDYKGRGKNIVLTFLQQSLDQMTDVNDFITLSPYSLMDQGMNSVLRYNVAYLKGLVFSLPYFRIVWRTGWWDFAKISSETSGYEQKK